MTAGTLIKNGLLPIKAKNKIFQLKVDSLKVKASTTSEAELKNIKTLSILNSVFVVALILDSILCATTSRWYFMFSSLFLLGGLLLSKIALTFNKNEIASLIVGIAFYIVSIYHAFVLDNLITSYFILLCAPIILVVLLTNIKNKIATLVSSCILFFVCNYGAGVELFENYFFFIGLFPCFFAMLYFYNRLDQLTQDKNELIKAQEQSNKEKILYAQMMSHDLKAPLQTIGGFSKLLEKQLNHKGEDAQMLKYILAATNSMETLIDDLLEYSKTDTLNYTFKEIEVNTLLSEALSIFSLDIKQEKIKIEKKSLGKIKANQKGIVAVFQNLISNSIKYQPLNKADQTVKIIIEQKESDLYDEIIIGDNGIGIKEENIPFLFDPFSRFHTQFDYAGTGLGLSICKKILQKHNGEISVLHSDKNGTSFLLRFPKK